MKATFSKLLDRILPPDDGDNYNAAPVEPEPRPKFTPQNTKELMEVLRRTPRDVLTSKERSIIASAMTFSDRKVKDIMIPLVDVPYVREDDYLGPFMLDKLYQSGLSHFPVIGKKSGQIVGVIHTESLNSLEIKEADKASKYLDPRVYYVRDDYTLEQALAALLRANCFFFIVLNKDAQTVGMLTYKDLIISIFGISPEDNFTGDADPFAVSHRA